MTNWGLTALWWKIRRPARGGVSAASEACRTTDPQAVTGAAGDGAPRAESVPASAALVYTPLQLAYLGDAVYELLVRRELLRRSAGTSSPAELHKETVARVRAGAQAAALVRILSRLTPEEQEIVRRARNARPKHSVPGGAEVWEYRSSSGLEALFGFLVLEGQVDRMEEIFRWILEEDGVRAPAPTPR